MPATGVDVERRVPTFDPEPCASALVNAADLLAAVRAAAGAAVAGRSGDPLAVVHFKFSASDVQVSGTDRYRAAHRVLDSTGIPALHAPAAVAIPRTQARAMIAVLTKDPAVKQPGGGAAELTITAERTLAVRTRQDSGPVWESAPPAHQHGNALDYPPVARLFHRAPASEGFRELEAVGLVVPASLLYNYADGLARIGGTYGENAVRVSIMLPAADDPEPVATVSTLQRTDTVSLPLAISDPVPAEIAGKRVVFDAQYLMDALRSISPTYAAPASARTRATMWFRTERNQEPVHGAVVFRAHGARPHDYAAPGHCLVTVRTPQEQAEDR